MEDEFEELLEKYKELMKKEVANVDTEVAHSNADDLLCELLQEIGFHEVVDLYNKVDKWYAY